MAKSNERTLVSFARPAPGYPLLVIGGLVLLCLAVALVVSLAADQSALAGLLLIALLGAVVFFWASLNQLRRVAGERNKNIAWNIDLPENQRTKLNKEVIHLAKILDISQEQLSDLLSAYIVAEDLALRQIQQEASVPVLRHVQLGSTPFDGVLVKNDILTCIEVTFLVTPNLSQEKIDAILNKMTATQAAFKKLQSDAKLRLLLVLVTQLDRAGEAKLRSSLVRKFDSTPVDVDIRLLDFEDLQKTYAIGD